MKTWEQVWEESARKLLNGVGYVLYHDEDDAPACLFMTIDEFKTRLPLGTPKREFVRYVQEEMGIFRDAHPSDLHVETMTNLRVVCVWHRDTHTCEVCGSQDESVTMWGAQLVHCARCASDWLAVAKHHDHIPYKKWEAAQRQLLGAHANCGQMTVGHAQMIEQTDGVDWETVAGKAMHKHYVPLIKHYVPLIKQFVAATEIASKASDALREDILSSESAQSAIVESARQIAEKSKPLPRLREIERDATYASQRRTEELEKLVQEIRGAVMRSMAAWPRCELCQEDWVVREVSLADGTVGVGHVCMQAKNNGETQYVKTKSIKYVFSDDVQKRMREYGIG